MILLERKLGESLSNTLHASFGPGHLSGWYGNLESDISYTKKKQRKWTSVPSIIRKSKGAI